MASIDDLPAPPDSKSSGSSIDDLPAPPSNLDKAMHYAQYLSPALFLANKARENPGSTQAFSEHAANSATLGYLPQIEAGAGLAANKIGLSDNNSDYLSRRDENIKRLAQQEKENPIASKYGTYSGIAATAAVPLGAISGATLPIRMAKSAALGAGIGAISNPGDTEGELNPIQGEGRLKGAALGAVVGSVAPPIAEGAGAVGSKLSTYFDELAARKANKAAGVMVPQAKALNKKGEDAAYQMGRTLLDQDVIPFFGTTGKIAENLDQKISTHSDSLNDLISEAQSKSGGTMEDMAPEAIEKIQSSQFKPKQVAEGLKSKLKEIYEGVPESKLQPAFDEIDSWLSNQPDTMRIQDVQNLKTRMNRFLKDSDFYRSNPGFAKEGMLRVRGALKSGVENHANAVAESMGEQGGQIKETNQTLGNLLNAQDIAENRLAHEEANRMFGLGDHIVGATGTGVGGAIGGAYGGPAGIKLGAALGGAAGAGGSKLARTFGNSIMARSADELSGIFGPELGEQFKKNPQLLPLLMSRLTENNLSNRNGQMDLNKPIISKEMLDKFRNKPDLLDQSKIDPALKEQIKKRLENRSPAKELMSQEDIKNQYLKGN